MSNNSSTIPKSLRDVLKIRQVIPFVGAGVSRAVEKKDKDPDKAFDPLFPSWKELIEILAVALKDEGKPDEAKLVEAYVSVKPPKYLDAMQHAFEQLSGSAWYKIFDEYLGVHKDKADESTLELAQLSWQLSSNLIITSNVDRVLQWTCPNQDKLRILDTQNVEYAQLQKEFPISRPTVWHLHGHIDNKERIIFTREQYEGFYDKRNHQAKLQTLLNFLTNRTFLFIGFSLDDPYFLKQLEFIHDIYKGGADSFYVLLPEWEKDNPRIPKYVRVIPFKDFGEPLLEIMREMRDLVEGENNSGNSKPPPKNPEDLLKNHFNVPFPSKGDAFVGRVGMIERIWDSLSRDGRAAIGQAVSIEGFGGLGKTQLAVEYAHHYRDKYENGVYWLTADENLDSQLIKIGENLSWISAFDKGFDQAELVRNRFRKLSDCLIVFDNVDDQNDIRDYLPERDARPHLLITSREEQSGFYPINLDVLSINEARALLIQIAEKQPDTEAEKQALKNILDELEGLPLAVELVGGYLLRRKNISFQEYYQFLQNEPLERIEKRFSDRTFTDHNKSIIRTLQISERLLNETRFLEDILDILAWSGKSSMGYSLLRDLVETNDNFALRDALGVALELRFIKQEENTERYAIHRLLARVRRHEKPLEQNQEWHRKIVNGIEQWFEPKIYYFNDLAEFEAEIAHLNEWQEQTFRLLPTESVLLTALRANPLRYRGNYQRAHDWLITAYQNYKQGSLDNQKLLADLHSFLAANYSDLGNYQEALKLNKQALEMRQELFGEKHPDIATSLNSLGVTYRDLGNHQEALKLNKQALEMRQELFGEKHPDIAASLNNLGATYRDLGNHQEALKLNKQALEMRQELSGEKHPDIATSLNNLGATYRDLGNHQEALKLYKQALEMFRELFGEKHPDIAASLNNLGLTYKELGNHQEALKLYKQALEMSQELFGEKHPLIAVYLYNLGLTYNELGDKKESIKLLDLSLKMSRELLGDKHPDTILICSHVINLLAKTGGIERSIRLAWEFLPYITMNSPNKWIFEKYGKNYGRAQKRKKRH
jgi:tetratricopeptide (TPR) repeat protein